MIANCFIKTSKRALALTTLILNIVILSSCAIISGICADEISGASNEMPSMLYFGLVGLLTLGGIYLNTASKEK